MSASNLLPPYTIDIDTARNYLSAFRSGTINNGTIVEFIRPVQQEILLNEYWAPKNKLGTDEKYNYANAPSCLTMKAFTFALDDITDLLNRISNFNGGTPVNFFPLERKEGSVTGIRFYLGMKPNPAYDSSMPDAPEYIPCLVFLPVTDFEAGYKKDDKYIPAKAGNDLTNLPILNEENIVELGSALYDFSFPCPNSCPVDELA